MSTESNKAVVRRFRDGLNAGNFDESDAVLADNLVVHMGSDPNPLNKESFVQLGRVSWSAFSGFTTTIEDIVAEGDKVVSRVTFRGTHTGDMMGIPPTGKSITISEIIIDRLADGKIVESWRLFDQMAMMQQLGLIPAPGQS